MRKPQRNCRERTFFCCPFASSAGEWCPPLRCLCVKYCDIMWHFTFYCSCSFLQFVLNVFFLSNAAGSRQLGLRRGSRVRGTLQTSC
uniref:Uncharacterized protein n=1 Tax=Anopheles aquasalis TaxID=42839 RepID=T1DHQ9_ANOAQ